MSISKIVTGVVLTLVLATLLFFVGCERINAGHVGIKVKNIGGDKGVSKIEYVTGWVFYIKTASHLLQGCLAALCRL